jgi:dihydroorotate dehydrogenase
VKIDGLVSSNTTIDRTLLNTTNFNTAETFGAGGLSGKPLLAKSTDVLTYLHKGLNGRIPIIASGGIFTGADAKEKIDAGASLVPFHNLKIWP